MNRGVVEPPLQHDAVGNGAQATVRGGVRLREERVGIIDVGESSRAAGYCAEGATVVHGSGFRFPNPESNPEPNRNGTPNRTAREPRTEPRT